MKSLNGIILPEALQWPDRHDWQPVAQEVVRTLSGTQVIFCAALIGGRPITLEAATEVAWLDQATVDALMVLAAQPGAVFSLVWDDATMPVIFRHQEPPVISVSPIWPHHTLYTGTIRLLGL